MNLCYLYLLSPLHTGGTTQEGNLLGIAREVHTDLPYVPSSTLRGRLRASTHKEQVKTLWGNDIDDVIKGGDSNLTQGALWVGDGAILWFPIPSLSHGVVWISSPFLLKRWSRITGQTLAIPPVGSFSHHNNNQALYLKDAIIQPNQLHAWREWQNFRTAHPEATTIEKVLILSDQDCSILIQSSLWRQVKVKLSDKKNVDKKNVKNGFRYEEAIPPETLMYFPWGTTAATKNGATPSATTQFQKLITDHSAIQIGGQESLGRGFCSVSLGGNHA
ncbi:type III-B CRISPR module RAMP protein Cmr4 [Anthocerotibacter panamensis]|uniref:type III-B CRISPR module RAMP protein Cmr4 n=1 Tax=Anthocerotibacter panamensis TaxID=2857077 RepID=UPI001C405A43|nr:type III-B CRISPR module RAMP protein Cmr4 [Anthocerotibacter panamensis]